MSAGWKRPAAGGLRLAVLACFLAASVAAAQTPPLANGGIETRTVSAGLAKDLPALAQAPMI